MTEHDKQQDFLNHASNVLDKSIETIDDETVRRLKQIRYQALEHKEKKTAWLKPLPAMAATAAALALEDMPLLTTNEDLDFYQELEFYNWLDDEQING